MSPQKCVEVLQCALEQIGGGNGSFPEVVMMILSMQGNVLSGDTDRIAFYASQMAEEGLASIQDRRQVTRKAIGRMAIDGILEEK